MLACWRTKRPRHSESTLPLIDELVVIVKQPLTEDEQVPISNERLRQLTLAIPSDTCSEEDLRRVFREGQDNMLS